MGGGGQCACRAAQDAESLIEEAIEDGREFGVDRGWVRGRRVGHRRTRTKKKASTRHGLSEVVRGFKSFSAKRVNELRGTTGVAVWQRGFYEHVVRNDEDLNRIREYIVGNPVRWSMKREGPEDGLREDGSQ